MMMAMPNTEHPLHVMFPPPRRGRAREGVETVHSMRKDFTPILAFPLAGGRNQFGAHELEQAIARNVTEILEA